MRLCCPLLLCADVIRECTAVKKLYHETRCTSTLDIAAKSSAGTVRVPLQVEMPVVSKLFNSKALDWHSLYSYPAFAPTPCGPNLNVKKTLKLKVERSLARTMSLLHCDTAPAVHCAAMRAGSKHSSASTELDASIAPQQIQQQKKRYTDCDGRITESGRLANINHSHLRDELRVGASGASLGRHTSPRLSLSLHFIWVSLQVSYSYRVLLRFDKFDFLNFMIKRRVFGGNGSDCAKA